MQIDMVQNIVCNFTPRTNVIPISGCNVYDSEQKASDALGLIVNKMMIQPVKSDQRAWSSIFLTELHSHVQEARTNHPDFCFPFRDWKTLRYFEMIEKEMSGFATRSSWVRYMGCWQNRSTRMYGYTIE